MLDIINLIILITIIFMLLYLIMNKKDKNIVININMITRQKKGKYKRK